MRKSNKITILIGMIVISLICLFPPKVIPHIPVSNTKTNRAFLFHGRSFYCTVLSRSKSPCQIMFSKFLFEILFVASVTGSVVLFNNIKNENTQKENIAIDDLQNKIAN